MARAGTRASTWAGKRIREGSLALLLLFLPARPTHPASFLVPAHTSPIRERFKYAPCLRPMLCTAEKHPHGVRQKSQRKNDKHNDKNRTENKINEKEISSEKSEILSQREDLDVPQ